MSDYTADPAWQEANRRWLEPRGADESATDRLARGVTAAFDKFRIETDHESGAA